MKTQPHEPIEAPIPLVRRDLVAIFAYVNPCGRSNRGVDGSLGSPADRELNRIAAAAGMQ